MYVHGNVQALHDLTFTLQTGICHKDCLQLKQQTLGKGVSQVTSYISQYSITIAKYLTKATY